MGVIQLLPRDGDDAYSFMDDHTMNMGFNLPSNSTMTLNSAVDPKYISGLDSPTYYIVKWVVITSLCGTVFLWFTLGYIHAKHRVRQGKKPHKYHRFLLPAHLRTHTSNNLSAQQHTLLTSRTPRNRNRRAGLHRPAYGRDTWGGDPPPEYSRDRPPSYQPPPSYAAPPPGVSKASPDQRIEEEDERRVVEIEIRELEGAVEGSSTRGTEMTTITPTARTATTVTTTPAVPPPVVLGAERRPSQPS